MYFYRIIIFFFFSIGYLEYTNLSSFTRLHKDKGVYINWPTDQPTNLPFPVMSSWAIAKDLNAPALTHPFYVPEILHCTSFRSRWQNLYPTRHVILSDSEDVLLNEVKNLSTSTWAPPPFLKHFETFLQTFSRLVQSLEFPRKMPHWLVSWSVGQFYIRRASHFA